MSSADEAPDVRFATMADVPDLRRLIDASVRALSSGLYTPEQIEAALQHVFGVDTQLIHDGTYFVIEASGEMAAAGGWSARETLFGGDQAKSGADAWLDPAASPARIRAFFVHPRWVRRGFARRIYQACESAARARGFCAFELVATLPGEPLYRSLGFVKMRDVNVQMPGGLVLPCHLMTRRLPPSSADSRRT